LKTTSKLWIGVGALALLSPLGIWLPAKLRGGSAWGEWDADEVHGLIGYVPRGLEKFSSLWNALFPDYTFKGMENAGLGHQSIAYIFSAVVGIAACVAAGFLIGKLLARKRISPGINVHEKKNKRLS
jgi:hypothetical protein